MVGVSRLAIVIADDQERERLWLKELLTKYLAAPAASL